MIMIEPLDDYFDGGARSILQYVIPFTGAQRMNERSAVHERELEEVTVNQFLEALILSLNVGRQQAMSCDRVWYSVPPEMSGQ